MAYANCSASISPNDYWYGASDLHRYTTTTTTTPVSVSTSVTDEDFNKMAKVLFETIGKEKEGEVKEENRLPKVTYKGNGDLRVSRFVAIPDIEKVIFNPPATVVIWSDGTKTVVKAREGVKSGHGWKIKPDKFSEEYGLAMAISKKYFGTRNGFLKAVKNAQRPDIPKAIVKKDAK